MPFLSGKQQAHSALCFLREYTWENENVRRLIDDLHRRFSAEWDARHDRTQASRYKAYFLGPYVYFQDGDTTYLVDGQQRVSTLHLLLILIRNLLLEQDAGGEARQLETLICNTMYGKRRYTIDIDERAPLLDALTRQDLYQRLCEIIWDPARLGFTLPEIRRIPGPAHRARSHYGVDVPRLMAARLLKAGDTLVAVHRGNEHRAIVVAQGFRGNVGHVTAGAIAI